MKRQHRTLIVRATAACAALGIVGCAGCGGGPILVDGDTGEWPAGVRVSADDQWLYIRFAPEIEPMALQAGARPTVILIDTDADPATGHRRSLPLAGIGAEVVVTLSPTGDDGSPGLGAEVLAFDADGAPTRLSHTDIGFHFAPTYASPTYEARVDRRSIGLDGGGDVAVGVAIGSGDDLWSTIATGWAAPIDPAGLPSLGETVPPRRLGQVRTVSWNVLRASTVAEPRRFGRVISALRPDVLLVQEWNGFDADQLAAWLEENAPIPNGRWSAVARADQGVGVATRLPVIARLDEDIEIPGERPVRFVGAIVDSGRGPVLVGSMHLKCCGSAGSAEDLRRMREAEAIVARIVRSIDRTGVRTVIIGGDLNLVGSRPALETLARGTDVDGSDLAIADPVGLGDPSMYTWRDPTSSFTPGRLDWVLVGDARARIDGAFIMDAARLSDKALSDAGLFPGDTEASDHLPVVVDVSFDGSDG